MNDASKLIGSMEELASLYKEQRDHLTKEVEKVKAERDEAREVADLLYSHLERPAYEVDQAIHKMMVMERYKQMKENK